MKTSQQSDAVSLAMSFDGYVVRRLEDGIYGQVSKAATDDAVARCYLRGFDALLDTLALFGQTGETHQATPVSSLEREFLVDGVTQKPIVVHLGWRAKGYRVLQRPGGRLAGVGHLQPARPEARDIAIEAQALVTMQGLFESAGIYAWREEYLVIEPRSKVRMLSDALKALCDADSDIRADVDDYDQIAVFDSEACEWHFVPRDSFFSPLEGWPHFR